MDWLKKFETGWRCAVARSDARPDAPPLEAYVKRCEN